LNPAEAGKVIFVEEEPPNMFLSLSPKEGFLSTSAAMPRAVLKDRQ